jgi:hypothetical protein
MGRPTIKTWRFRKAETLVANGARIDDACRQMGISRATFFRHRSKKSASRYPPVKQDWTQLAASFLPRQFRRLKPPALRNFRLETAEVFLRTFGRPGLVRTSKQSADQLNAFLKRVDEVTHGYHQLDTDLINRIDDLKEHYPNVAGFIGPAIERLREYQRPLRVQIQELRRAGRVGRADRGGRTTDPRVLTATVGLARIFSVYAKKIPTHRTSPSSGRDVSAFNRFTRNAFDHFLPAGTIRKHALRDATRNAAARADWTEEASGSAQ